MSIQDRLISPNQGIHMGGTQNIVNPFTSGQQGPVGQVGKYVTNASRLRRGVIPRVMEFPHWVEYMPNPQIWRMAIKSFIEVHTTMSGLDKGLTAEYVETQQGRNNRIQYEAGNVVEAQSSINHTTVDKHGKVYQNMLTAWLRYGVCDTETGHPGIAAINPNVPDHLPDMYSMTTLYLEPDAFLRKVVNAFWETNMAPRTNGPDIGDRDPNQGPQTNELSIDFTSQQDTTWGVMQLAQRELERMKLHGLRPMERKAYMDSVKADVDATPGGYYNVASDLENNRIS